MKCRSFWTEVRACFSEDIEEDTPVVYIMGLETDSEEDQGTILAKVYIGKIPKVEIVNNRGRKDKEVLKVIKETIEGTSEIGEVLCV